MTFGEKVRQLNTRFRLAAEALFAGAGAFEVGRVALAGLHGSRYFRAINYHETPLAAAASLREHIEFYSRHFCNVSPQQLRPFFGGQWAPEKPGLMLCFDDGDESNYDVAAPLLEAFGFTGYFFVCPHLVGRDGRALQTDADADGFVDAEARAWRGPVIDYRKRFMSWEQVRDLVKRGHAVGSHTLNHIRMSAEVPEPVMHREIAQSRDKIARELGSECDMFCWVGGEKQNYSRNAERHIAAAGYSLSLLTNAGVMTSRSSARRIQRTNIGASWPLYRVRFALSGIVDLVYASKRHAVNAELKL